jgi:hypothetical protein
VTVLAVGLAIRFGAAATAVIWFDEATVGRMGQDVLAGRFPFFFYGQAFMGAMDGYFHALPFALVGPSPSMLRVWPLVLSLVHVGLVGLIARRILGYASSATVLALIPPAFLLKWAQDARLHFDLVPVLTVLLLLLGLAALDPTRSPVARTRAFLILALVGAFAWWINLLLTLPLGAAGVAILLIRPRLTRAAWAAPLAAAVGSAPYWLFVAWQGRFATLGVPLAPPAALLDHAHYLVDRAIPILVGVAYPVQEAPGGWLAARVAAGLFLAAVLVTIADRRAEPRGRLLLALVVGTSVATAVATVRGVNLATEDPRYLLPVAAVLPVLFAGFLGRLARAWPVAGVSVTVLLLGLQGLGLAAEYPALRSRQAWTSQRARQAQIQGVADQLVAEGLTAVYTHDPDVLTFVTAGRVATSHVYLDSDPALSRRVDGAPHVAYLSGARPPGFEESVGAMGARFKARATSLGALYTSFTMEGDALREIPPTRWVVTASDRPERAQHAVDRDGSSAWDSGRPRQDGMWFQVDLGGVFDVSMVAWLPRGYQEVPLGFRLETSLDGAHWTVAGEVPTYYGPLYWSGGHPMGRVRAGRVEVRFASRPTSHLRLTHLGGDRRFHWTIRELWVYEGWTAIPPTPESIAPVLEALQAAGVQRVYADHGVGARLAEASGGALAILPANVAVDLYGAVPPIDVLPQFRPNADAAIVVPAGLPSEPTIEATLDTMGIAFASRDAGGYRLLTGFAPRAQTWHTAAPPAGVGVRGSAVGMDAAAVMDGRLDTRWSTAGPQKPGDWLQLDLPAPVELAGVELELGRFRWDYPRGLAVELIGEDGAWRALPATVVLKGPLAWTGTHLVRLGADRVVVTFPPTRTRGLRLLQTGRDGIFDWSIAELRLRTP